MQEARERLHARIGERLGEHAVARLGERREDREHRVLRAGADEHLLGRGGDAVARRPGRARRRDGAARRRAADSAAARRGRRRLASVAERAREIGGESDDRKVEAQVDDGRARRGAARERRSSAAAAGPTNVPRPTSPRTRPRRSASAYARVTVPIATPSTSASSRCVGRRSPSGKRSGRDVGRERVGDRGVARLRCPPAAAASRLS